jgi:gamma-glutamyl-gamma-aminobutyrate hydrolase PuuD
MSWEKRGNSDYYYRKCRIGDRVVSQYFGGGTIAKLVASQDQLEHEQASAQKSAQHQIRIEEKEWNRLVSSVYERNTLLFKAVMLVNGYHTHKGQWRRKNAQSRTLR